MSTAKTYQMLSSSSSDTLGVGERLGANCIGGEVFVLNSDLGGGKTTLTKGLAKGLGSQDVVNSPTFMVERLYDCRDGIIIHHFDFYRLQEGGMVAQELAETLADPKAVIVVEWGDIINDVLPVDHVNIKLERLASGEDDRKITVSSTSKFSHLIEALK